MSCVLSIIIVNYNTSQLLSDCLHSVEHCSDSLSPEVIVVDNNSSDGSIDMVRRDFPNVRLISNSTNIGFAAANNKGLEIASGEFILFLNSDTALKPSALVPAVAYMCDNPKIGILGCKVLNRDGSVQPSARDFPTIWTLLLEMTALSKLFPHSGIFRNPWITDTDRIQDVDVVKGAYLLTRRITVRDVGPMDEQFFLYSEEQDWCLRAKKSGWRTVYFPKSEIFHHDGGSSPIKKDSSRFLLFESEIKYFKKHYGTVYSIIAKYEMMCAVLFRLILWSLVTMAALVLLRNPDKHKTKLKFYWYAFLAFFT